MDRSQIFEYMPSEQILNNQKFFRVFLKELKVKKEPRVVFDLSKLEELSGQQLGNLIYVLQKILKRRGQLMLVGLQDKPRLLFEITQADQVFPIFRDIPTALQHLKC